MPPSPCLSSVSKEAKECDALLPLIVCVVFTVTGKEPVAHRGRERQQKPQTDGQEVTPEAAAIHIPHHTLTLSYAWTEKGAWRASHFMKNHWKDGIGNDQERGKTQGVRSPMCAQACKKLGLQGQRGRERGRGEEMKKWNGISRSLSPLNRDFEREKEGGALSGAPPAPRVGF